MKTEVVILKTLISPFLIKDSGFKSEKASSDFWEKITEDFLNFEKDQKPIYAAVYSLDLKDPEKVIKELQNFYYSFLEELAEQTVLNHSSDSSNRLHKVNNPVFIERVAFLQEMKNAITSLERERLRKETPLIFDSISYEFSDEVIETSIKKQAREDLRTKFKQWDLEKKKEELNDVSSNIKFSIGTPQNSIKEDKEQYQLQNASKEDKGKVISISWIKYAAAACVIIAAGLFYFDSTQNRFPSGNEMVDTDGEEEIKMEEENIQLADLKASSKNLEVLQNAGLSYSETFIDKSVKVTFINADERISSLHEILKENEFNTSIYKEELSRLQYSQNKYIFKDQQLTFYREALNENLKIIQLSENQYYLQKGNEFYPLKISDAPQELSPENNENVIEQLEKIIFINE